MTHRLPVLVALTATLAGCAGQTGLGPAPARPAATRAIDATWKPVAAAQLRPAAPGLPTEAEQQEVLGWRTRRTPEVEAQIKAWNEAEPVTRWSAIARRTLAEEQLAQPADARAMAIVHAAIYDAVVASWDAKTAYQRRGPGEAADASFPSEHAAIAAAASGALATLFPSRREALARDAETAGLTRIQAGLAFRSDVTAGEAIGRAAARAHAGRVAEGPGTSARAFPQVAGKWFSVSPVAPAAGAWQRWLTLGPDLPAPPMPGTPAFETAADEVVAIASKATPKQLALGRQWDAEPPALLWNDHARRLFASQQLDTPQIARGLAYMHMAIADAFVASWAAKYQYLIPRPSQARPGFTPGLKDPQHPSYPSHAAITAAAAAAFLGGVVPAEKAELDRQAAEAADTRIWGGVHYRFDRDQGFEAGTKLGLAALRDARIR